MTDPIFLPSPDHIHKTSFFLYHVSPADLFHLSPHPHLKSLQSPDIFLLICPCFSCIESYTPYYSFDDSFLYNNNYNLHVSDIRVSNRTLIYNVCPKSTLT